MSGAKGAAAGANIFLKTWAAGEAAKANYKNDIRNAQIAQQARKIAFNRESQAYMKNQQNLREQNTSDNFNISIAEAQARDNLATATAGSGLAGTSIDELSSEITREVGKDRVAARRSMIDQKDAMNQQRIQSNENRVIEAENEGVQDYNTEIAGAFYSAVGDALMM